MFMGRFILRCAQPTYKAHLPNNKRDPLPLNFSEQTNTPHAAPQFMKVWKQKK